ncbi:hypothetical protein M0E87_10655 [Corynebacterium sp. CCM 9185]|uniref:Uncharacterized protein n=1 Tax=Corynebacterium marambiense TaxID=2765364 RepID=A0ABS0VUD3_9CORY|nr:hypothetical protein [Corynebacterium marambiense]MBI9000360.1 hypothetical protein [Corynebacterium marambiense]MCK7664110.1 hypothetical protein [Corynebacterium marambiense]MCX7543583.1 hypothetical protein [Corynebacterium marambiense]
MPGHPKPGPRLGGPLPGDPGASRMTPEQLATSLDAVLGEAPATLAEEADQLTRAHQILHDALQ